MVSYLWDNLFKRAPKDLEIETVLSENYIFKALNKTEMAFIKSLVHYRVYRPGEAIFRQGELGVGMYMIVKGHVNITVDDLRAADELHKNIFVTRLTKGDFFGEIALVEQTGRRTATATAAEEVALLGFFKPDLTEIIERNPRMGVKILARLGEVLGRRLKETADRFTEVKRELHDLAGDDAKD
jgi:CRP/FNR family transcriptional regulator, cyclic AMP receptor protein